jgi:hypothetical protein
MLAFPWGQFDQTSVSSQREKPAVGFEANRENGGTSCIHGFAGFCVSSVNKSALLSIPELNATVDVIDQQE